MLNSAGLLYGYIAGIPVEEEQLGVLCVHSYQCYMQNWKNEIQKIRENIADDIEIEFYFAIGESKKIKQLNRIVVSDIRKAYEKCENGMKEKQLDIYGNYFLNKLLETGIMEESVKFPRSSEMRSEEWTMVSFWFGESPEDKGYLLMDETAKIWLNTQSWAVISGTGDREKQLRAMDSVKEYLDTPLGIKKIDPAMETDYPSKEVNLTMYNKGCGENGSVFCHAITWAIIAECMLGRADRAYKYYRQLLPMIAQKTAGEERYRAEPYVYCSNIFGPESDKFGLANVSWLTGTAAWMYIAVTEYMLGIKPRWDGLEISPCLPQEMLPAKVTRVFRGKTYEIEITDNSKQFIEVSER